MISGEAFAAAWFNEDWAYRKTITVVGPVINGPHADFPLLVSISSDANLVASAQPNGGDILFTSSDGTTKLAHEIESFNSGTGALTAWVKIPAPGIDNGTVIYMYYGDADYATNGDQWETDGSTWDSDYEGVWHLSETPGNGGTHYDSTSNNVDGTWNDADASSDTNATGKMAGADDLDGSDNITTGSPNFNMSYVTMCAWIYPKGMTGNHVFVEYGDTVNPDRLGFRLAADGWIDVMDGNGSPSGYYDSDITTGNWYYLCFTGKGTTGGLTPNSGSNNDLVRMFIDGVYVFGGINNDYLPSVGSDAFTIGSRINGAQKFNGIIDEVRVSNVVRSDDWIKTSYNNQNAPSSFLTVSEQVSIPTMTEWGMIIFMVLAGLGSIYYLRKKRIES